MAIPRSGFRVDRRVGLSRAGLPTKSGAAATVKVFGVPQAIAKFNRVGQVAFRDIGYIMYRAAIGTRDKAKANINPHRRTGNLEDGIEIEKVSVYDWRVTASSRAGGSNREYAAHVEYGTRHMDAIPYMRPAVSQQRQETMAALTALALRIQRI